MQASADSEAQVLADTEYGAKILSVLSKVYMLQAEIYLGGKSVLFAQQRVFHDEPEISLFSYKHF